MGKDEEEGETGERQEGGEVMGANPQTLFGRRFSPEDSARVNERIRQLHQLGRLRLETLAIIKTEFGVDLSYQSFRDRERSLGLLFRGNRATGAESDRMNERIRQLCEQRTPGRQMVVIINGEFERALSHTAIYHRAEEMGLKVIRAHPRPSVNRDLVPQEQREACLEDPAWEARKWINISDRIACRECFRFYKGGGLCAHVKTQHAGIEEYRKAHPGARLFSFAFVARDIGRDCQELMQESGDLYATPEERAEAMRLGEAYYEHGAKYVICCVARCGLKATDVGQHLRSVHHMSASEYRMKYGPHLPVTSFAQLAQGRIRGEKRKAELVQLRKIAGHYPSDWDQKPIEWRIIGMELLLHPGVANKQLGKLLDASRIITCPYSKGGWEDALSQAGRAANYISEIRKWLGRPGQTPRSK